MDLRHEHEEGLAVFVSPQRRARFRASLADVRLRQKLLDGLNHFEDSLDSRHAELHRPHTRHESHVEQVCDLLEDAGAPGTCFLLADSDADGAEVPLRHGVKALMSRGAGFLSCVPGRLGLYVSEDGSNVFILRRLKGLHD